MSMRSRCCTFVVFVACGGTIAPAQVASPPDAASKTEFRAEVERVGTDGGLLLADGRRLRLQGVSLPSAAVRPAGFAKRLVTALKQRLRAAGNRVFVRSDTEQPVAGADLVAVVRTGKGGDSLNEEMLRQGLCLFSCRTSRVTEIARLLAASKSAQRAGRGWFARGAARRFTSAPYLNGAVVGLHHQEPERNYHRQVDELAAAGFTHLELLFSVFVQKVDSVRIIRSHKRTVRDSRLIETIRYAKKKGLSVFLLPILLILEPGDDDWRGVLKPRDEEQFWQNYDRFLAHYLDIAESTGVELFCIGSELGSLEDRTATWKRLITNARGRYRGLLTYSANWDHAHTPRFFAQLDVVGMTAYFSLTKKLDPTLAELQVEWQRITVELRKTHAWHGRPVIFTELGFASQNGINRDPWNYVMAKEDIDLQEQADCFAAFLRAAAKMEFLRGAYFYDYYDLGGRDDWSYSPRGKPAMAYWRQWAKTGKRR